MLADQLPVGLFRLTGRGLWFFATRWWKVVPMKVKFGVEESNIGLLHSKFHIHRYRGGVFDANNLWNFTNFGEFGPPQQISTGFTSWLHYCSDVTQLKWTKLCMMFGHLLGWHTIYTFSAALAPCRNFARCKIHFVSKSCVLLYWQR